MNALRSLAASVLFAALAACEEPPPVQQPAVPGALDARAPVAALLPEPDLSQITETILGGEPDAPACNRARAEAQAAMAAGQTGVALLAADAARQTCPEALWRAFVPETCAALTFACSDLEH